MRFVIKEAKSDVYDCPYVHRVSMWQAVDRPSRGRSTAAPSRGRRRDASASAGTRSSRTPTPTPTATSPPSWPRISTTDASSLRNFVSNSGLRWKISPRLIVLSIKLVDGLDGLDTWRGDRRKCGQHLGSTVDEFC